MALDSTVGTLTANAYCDVAFADSFINNEVVEGDQDLWNNINSTSTKERLLIRATQQLDNSYMWAGQRANLGDGETTGQSLDWPRKSVKARDGVTLLPNDLIPKDIKKAVVLLAVAFSERDRAADSELSPLKSLETDGTVLEWRDDLPSSQATIPSKVHDYARKYGTLKSSLNSESNGVGNIRMVKK